MPTFEVKHEVELLIAHRVEAATADEPNSIAVKSVEADGGTLSITNSPGKGCVSIYLPQHEPK